MSSCKVKLPDGRSYDFGPRVTEVKKFLSTPATLKGMYAFIGDSPSKESANLKEAKRLLENCSVKCKSQRGASFYRPSGLEYGLFGKFYQEEIVLKLKYNYFRSFENFSHLILHEYTHGLVPCDGRLTEEEHVYYSRFKSRVSGFHCTAFKRALLYFCLLYTSPSPRDATLSRMPSSA